MENFVVISGCSGGGKSTLLDALRRRGHPVVPEPGRRIVAEEMRSDGHALPWVDLAAFAERALAMALGDRRDMQTAEGWVFFDRGLVDAAAALEHATGRPVLAELGMAHRYHRSVFLTPPWPEIYQSDGERQHDFASAAAEYDRLLKAYNALGYRTLLLPKCSVEERADFILTHLPT
ncbi:ATPase [Pseudorhizobium endolithicum]|uniref:ATPase n=1 Tax=Pseudorhizobium endolithicum TaxID=1191678 RepID=A0ABN7K0X3_9HYPH|nr:AAA family ATPase [Pseudorhizobium endolithicum]CAD6409330.1 ATPase [Rhizobium sp. Q54]CAD7050510.1 ATPase [Pseudorhizobium endolithicum]